jgi:hypothetical protein
MICSFLKVSEIPETADNILPYIKNIVPGAFSDAIDF